MELSELEKNWQMFSERLEENTRINKRILNEMMIRKPRKRIQLLQLESGIRTLLFIVLCISFIVKFDTTVLSLRGIMLIYIILFGGMYIYFSSFQVYRLLGKVDFAKHVQENNKLFVQLEKNKLRLKTLNVWSYLIGILLLAYLATTKWEIILEASSEFFVPILIVGIGGTVFSIFRTRVLQRQLQKLKDEMDELS